MAYSPDGKPFPESVGTVDYGVKYDSQDLSAIEQNLMRSQSNVDTDLNDLCEIIMHYVDRRH